MVPSRLIQLAASVIVILGFIAASVAWGLSTQSKADKALEKVAALEKAAKADRELLDAMFGMTCQLLFHQLGPQTKRVPQGCEQFRPLTRE